MRRRHSDASVDGVPVEVPSTTLGPLPGISLPDLPVALFDDVARRAIQLGAGGALSLTCRSLSKTNLLHAPALHIQLESQRCDRLLTPRVVAVLKARTCKLALTLEQQRAQCHTQYIPLLTNVLMKLTSCAAVEVCKLCTSKGPSLPHKRYKRLGCSPDLAQHLMDGFPSLTSLSLHNYAIPCSGLASLLSHPQLALQLQQLDLSSSTITHLKRPGPGAATLANLFHASRVKQLSLLISSTAGEGWNRQKLLLPNLQPLSQHLTQLCLMLQSGEGLDKFTAPLRPLAQLQVLKISCIHRLEGLPRLLQALPRLHTLQLPDAAVKGQEQMDALLAATQLTSIQLSSMKGLTSSCADVPCSWQRLELTGRGGWMTLTYLPLHSLSQALVLGHLGIRARDNPDVAAALHLLAEAITVPVQIMELAVNMRSPDYLEVITPELLQQQGVDLAQLVALLQPLQCCGKVNVRGLYEVTADDVLALAPLCRDCTHFALHGGSMEPSLQFWRQPVQLMPAVQKVSFYCVKGAAALHNMAYAVKVPVMINCMQLDTLTTEDERSGVITPALLQQQRVDLAQLVALLQPLQCCSAVLIADLHGVTAADILALACMCRDCTHFEVEEESSIEFRRQMVQLMPAVQLVTFGSDKYVPAAMHESLQFMAEHPWAQWLDITICTSLSTCMLAERQLVQERPFQSQQTAPAMSQRDMQHQAAVDGGALATDGYSPAGEAPPPATRLLDLPPALLDDIACRVMQLGARSLLPLTCRAFSQARLLHIPALRIQLGRQCCEQLLTPRVVAALQARTSKLALTLWQPETEDSKCYEEQLAPTLQLPQTEYTQDCTDLLAHALAKLDNCAAVEVCKLVSSGVNPDDELKDLRCSPGLAQHLLDSFPRLTALTLEGLRVSSNALASLLSHPSLALHLQQLDIAHIISQDGDTPGAVGTLFQGLQLKQLSIAAVDPERHGTPPLPSFQHLAQHLTKLHLVIGYRCEIDLSFFLEYLQPLAQLQVLTITTWCNPDSRMEGLTELLQALLQVLPQLHTLQLPYVSVSGHQQLDALLAATQITSLQFYSVQACDTSYADVPCSWQRLELTRRINSSGIAYLPLHSLTQPLVLGRLHIIVKNIADPVVAAILHHLAEACKVPVRIKEVDLVMRDPSRKVITPPLLQQQRKDLAVLGALLQPLRCCGKVKVTYLHEVTAADVQAVAPLCQDCTHFELYGGSVDPSLDFWHQLVQLMPAVQKLSLLQPLRSFCVAKVVVYDLRKVTAGDVVALAPLCQDCTYFQLEGGSMEPSLEFWHQLVQIMPAVEKPSCSTHSAGQQIVPAMSQRDMQHQAAVDGGASATNGYCPAGEAPPPATRLLDLPPVLLDDIACRVMQLGARSLLPLTCRAFSLARLLHGPALRIQLGRGRCDQLLTPRVVPALQARKSKLELTLDLPLTEYTQDYTDLLAHALAKLNNCAAVEVCNLISIRVYSPYTTPNHLHCPPGLAQHLLDSFPSLTALSIQGPCVSRDALASLLSHPPLALQLQQLDLTNICFLEGDERGAVGPVFQGLRLKQLSIASVRPKPGTPPLPTLQPLAQHLTQLHLQYFSHNKGYLVSLPSINTNLGLFMEYLQPLAQLQVLTISQSRRMNGLTELLQALPQLHTLQLPDAEVRGQQELNTLLAATQITSLQLSDIGGLDTSYGDAPCSWQRLELTRRLGWKAITYLPLHSLSRPLVLGHLKISVEDITDPEVAAALQLLAEAIKVPMQITRLELNMRSLEHLGVGSTMCKRLWVNTLRQQRVDLARLVALLPPLRCCSKVMVSDLQEVTAADVLALAPLCRDCTHFQLDGGSVKPSHKFWHQLVQLMPAVQQVVFHNVERCVSAAMHNSLQRMAKQPWARWLDITLHYQCEKNASSPYSQLPACWQAGTWMKTGIFKVSMWAEYRM
ncbi:hypothetical protein QJQ45_027010 [Haematococcus lacustris]|nr:hypothetical protein QJQ45_027010 [Haematococcus lacustris]